MPVVLAEKDRWLEKVNVFAYIYIYIYIYIYRPCRAASTDIPDPLSSLLHPVHRFWPVFRATSRILT